MLDKSEYYCVVFGSWWKNWFSNKGDYELLSVFKEKSWSVRLVDGYILGNQVKGTHCDNCEGMSKLVANNFSNPNMVLFGCNGHKCKHRLIRLYFCSENLGISNLAKYSISVRTDSGNTKL